MRWPWDSEGRDVPEERVPTAPTGETEPGDEFDRLVSGLEIPVPTDLNAELTPELRSAVLVVDAVCQVAGQLHASPDLSFQLQEEFPYIAEVLQGGPFRYLARVTRDGDDGLVLVDTVTEWFDKLVGKLGLLLSQWLDAHHMPPHIHAWVTLPGMGFTLVRVGVHEDEPNIYIQIPPEVIGA